MIVQAFFLPALIMLILTYTVSMRKKNQIYNTQSNSERSRQQAALSDRKAQLVEALQLPKDVCLGALRVTMMGSCEAWIENYRGILEYTEVRILLQGKNCQVCFEGSRLSIDYYTNEDMKISGHIRCVSYL